MISNITSKTDDEPSTDTMPVETDTDPAPDGEPPTGSATPDRDTTTSGPDDEHPAGPHTDETPPETVTDATTDVPSAFSGTLTGGVLATLLDPYRASPYSRRPGWTSGLTRSEPGTWTS